jgi:septum formation protein
VETGQDSFWVVIAECLKAMFEGYKFALLSKSPRRALLLQEMGLEFQVVKPGIDEVCPDGTPALEVPSCLSRQKALACQDLLGEDVVKIAADTVVIIDGEILGKPKDKTEAVEMLRKLSGRANQVVTGVTVAWKDKLSVFSEVTDVKFAVLSDEEINFYIDQYRPYDKAGAYGIQEWIGLIGIEAIHGCYYNVMGLPVSRLYRELKKMLTDSAFAEKY